MVKKTESLEKKLQEIKEKSFPRTTIGDSRFRSGRFVTVTPELVVKLSDVEDFVELYQKTRQTLHQQIEDEQDRLIKFVKREGRRYDRISDQWFRDEALPLEIRKRFSRVLSLLDRPNEDYIVIKRKQLQDIFKEKPNDKNLLMKARNGWISATGRADYCRSHEAMYVYRDQMEGDWIPKLKELLELPNKKEK